MFKTLDEKMIGMKLRATRFVQELCEEERGESNFVAVLLIIVIAVAVATIFRRQLSNLVNTVFNQINTFVGP